MKLRFAVTIVIIACGLAQAQVGINTIEPKSLLDVVSSNPSAPKATDGILVPRIDRFPSGTELPTSAQTGMLVYLTTAQGDNAAGFYFYNGTQFINVTDAASGAFYKKGTTNFATTTTDDVVRNGKVSIGSSLSSGKLNVDVVSDNNALNPIGLKVENNNTGVGVIDTYGAFLENNSLVSGIGVKHGLRSDVSSSGDSDRVGFLNQVSSSQNSVQNGVIGINNIVGATTGATSTNIGIRSEIGTATSDANSYGILSVARGVDTKNNYSGYFQGDKFAIRNETNNDGYDMPTVDGKPGQVLTTDGNKVATWQDATHKVTASRAVLSANQTHRLASYWDKLLFNISRVDEGNGYNAPASKFVAGVNGTYRVHAQFTGATTSNNNKTVGIGVFVNGVERIRKINYYSSNTDTTVHNIDSFISLNNGDEVEIYFVFTGGGGNLVVDSEEGKTFFEVHKL